MSENDQYDVIVVGAGIAGALTSKYLTRRGFRVLVLEAGPATAQSFDSYTRHVETFYAATAKGPESAWPPAMAAPQPDTGDLSANAGYFVQNGPDKFGSTYSRLQGGSTLHWLGVCLRMLPEDFKLRSRHGVGLDWPLSYDELEPFYRTAEREIGVSADVADQDHLGIWFAKDYDYPMRRIPLSFSDRMLERTVNGLEVELEKERFALEVRSYPAGRNSIPRDDYAPVGAVDQAVEGGGAEGYLGQRCAGNTSCTPICPIQAKYNAGKTLAQADWNRLRVLPQAVASKIQVDSGSGIVQGIEYKRYADPNSSAHEVHFAKARVYVLAAHAVENAKLMLVSGLGGDDSLIGKNLMDHPALYAWGLAPSPTGAFRGPLSTAGIEDLRGGKFRGSHAAFRFDIGNDGWRAATGAPDTAVMSAVMNDGLFGHRLRDRLGLQLRHQIRLSLAVEQLPDPGNSVSIDSKYLDPLGIPRPVIRYKIDEYTLRGMAAATRVYRQIFERAQIKDCTNPQIAAARFPSVTYGDTVFYYHGMGHFAGTHVMGADRAHSVVDAQQCSWNHRNLYLVGAGSFPTMGTSNPTLTLAALAIRTAQHLVGELKQALAGPAGAGYPT